MARLTENRRTISHQQEWWESRLNFLRSLTLAVQNSPKPASCFHRNWPLLGIRALAASIFVILTAVVVSTALEKLPALLGTFWAIDGFLVLSSAVRSTRPEERSELLVFAGIVSIVLGMSLPVLLETTSLSLAAAIAAWGLATGLLLAAAVLNIDVPEVRSHFGASAAVSLLLGLVTAYSDPSDAIVTKWILAHGVAQSYLMGTLAGKLKLENERSRG
jgi:uncharacterized membrane protein HdeD (DUF308 family)